MKGAVQGLDPSNINVNNAAVQAALRLYQNTVAAVIAGRISGPRPNVHLTYLKNPVTGQIVDVPDLGRRLQSATSTEAGISIILPASSVSGDASGSAVIAAQTAAANSIVSALESATSDGSFAASMASVMDNLASAVGLAPGALSASVDTASAVLTTGSPRATPAPDSNKLSGGAIAGIAVGCVVGAVLIAVGIAAMSGAFKKKPEPVRPADSAADAAADWGTAAAPAGAGATVVFMAPSGATTTQALRV